MRHLTILCFILLVSSIYGSTAKCQSAKGSKSTCNRLKKKASCTRIRCNQEYECRCRLARLSVSPTPTPSTSTSKVPIASPSASPSSSASQTPAASPTSVVLPKGPCTPGVTTCSSGYSCGCSGICTKQIKLKITTVGDDRLRLYTCGKFIGFTSSFNNKKEIEYMGGCDDIMVRVNNDFDGESDNFMAAVVLVEVDGGETFGTRSNKRGVRKLQAIITPAPAAGWLKNKPGFDFSTWKNVKIVTNLEGFGNFKLLKALGARAIGISAKPVPNGIYGIKIDVPYC